MFERARATRALAHALTCTEAGTMETMHTYKCRAPEAKSNQHSSKPTQTIILLEPTRAAIS